jgi:ADP-ribosyl-[dinitrogen reductase] hydrolase
MHHRPKLTSRTHPLKIAALELGHGRGRIGITFCPGKKDPRSLSGIWDRDLALDLGSIAEWGAQAVVTLVEAHELDALKVPNLGAETTRRHMAWHHLPIPDVTAPGAEFEAGWTVVGPGLRAILRDGFDVLVHCKGGLGRAGTIAARLAVELGMDAEDAIQRVRALRPGAIETASQEAHVRSCREIEDGTPRVDDEARLDRAVGALLGLAVGDALGTTLEFTPRDDRADLLVDMIGGGPFHLAAGGWTDDTSMALALADSLLAADPFDPRDLASRFLRWWRMGEYSHTGRCFDIGNTTRAALERFERTGEPLAGSSDPRSAGNGSLMRLAPVAIRYSRNAVARRDAARLQSRTTHGAAEAVDACAFFADLLAEAIEGRSRPDILSPRGFEGAAKIVSIASGSWRGKVRGAIRGSGYVVDALEAALWCVGSTSTFAEAVLKAVNLRDDADTTAAITGQLAGALHGATGIPGNWCEKLLWGSHIVEIATLLLEDVGTLGADATGPV